MVSEKLDHLHFVIVDIPFLEPLEENTVPFNVLFPGIIIIKIEGAKPQIPHYGVIDVDEIEHSENYHQHREDPHD